MHENISFGLLAPLTRRSSVECPLDKTSSQVHASHYAIETSRFLYEDTLLTLHLGRYEISFDSTFVHASLNARSMLALPKKRELSKLQALRRFPASPQILRSTRRRGSRTSVTVGRPSVKFLRDSTGRSL